MDITKPNPDDPTRPVVDPAKRTTKVNMGVVIGVVVFLGLSILAMCSVIRNPPQNEHEVAPEVTPSVP